jgi:hypothetical protein
MWTSFWKRGFAPVDAIESFDAPWARGKPSLHDIIVRAGAHGRSVDEAVRDATPAPDDNQVRFVAGGLDGILGRGAGQSDANARVLTAAIGKVLRIPSTENAAHLYRLLCNHNTLSVVDQVIPLALREVGDRRDALAALARRLVREAPDNEPVKAAIALLGVSGGPGDVPLVAAMGTHEEFTLYSVVAFTHLLEHPEPAVWDLARKVYGWGRIAAVERLAKTQDPTIKAWMLRDGFRNRIMNEELAYTCATAGGLREAITASEVDDDLLIGAGEILAALISGNPGRPIEDYDGGAVSALAFLRHMATRPLTDLRTIESALRIRGLVENGRDRLSEKADWSAETILEIKTLTGALLQSAVARQTVEAALGATDEIAFNTAADLAMGFGIDAWPLRLARQQNTNLDSWFHQWWWLMQTDDPQRIEQVLHLARIQLDLNLIGSGPMTGLGLGVAFKDDNEFVFIVQDLKRFPGRGWDLLKVALNGRTIRLRNMAINALRDWGKAAWPPDAAAEIEAAERREPDGKVRARFRALLTGKLKE